MDRKRKSISELSLTMDAARMTYSFVPSGGGCAVSASTGGLACPLIFLQYSASIQFRLLDGKLKFEQQTFFKSTVNNQDIGSEVYKQIILQSPNL